MNKLRSCLIGCGDIGYAFDRDRSGEGSLTHFKTMQESGDFDLLGIAETRPDVRNEINEKFGIACYENSVRMLEELAPDVVVIASSDETHIPMLRSVLNFSPKLVFCEKPLGLDEVEVGEVVNEYGERDVRLLVNYTRRFLDEFHELHNELKSGLIGKVNSATFYYSRGLVHNASHYIDLVNWYFGKPASVTPLSNRDGIGQHDKSYTFRLGYDDGPEIIFIGLEPSKISFAEIDIVGSQGRIKFNYRNELEYFSITDNPAYKGFQMFEHTKTIPVRFEFALPNAYRNIANNIWNSAELRSPGAESEKIFDTITRIKNQQDA